MNAQELVLLAEEFQLEPGLVPFFQHIAAVLPKIDAGNIPIAFLCGHILVDPRVVGLSVELPMEFCDKNF